MIKGGAKVWYFPDGYLPEKKNNGPMEAHEALMIMNVSSKAAKVKLDFYFDDKPPVKNVTLDVSAERVKGLRLDHPEEFGGPVIPPLKQYAIRVRSNVPVVSMFARVDTTQDAMAYYANQGYPES